MSAPALPDGWTECPECKVALKRRGLGAHKGSKSCITKKRHDREQRIYTNKADRVVRRVQSLQRRGYALVNAEDGQLPRDVRRVRVETVESGTWVFAPRHELLALRVGRAFGSKTRERQAAWYPTLAFLGATRLTRMLFRRLRADRDYRKRFLSVADMDGGDGPLPVTSLLEFLEGTFWGAAP